MREAETTSLTLADISTRVPDLRGRLEADAALDRYTWLKVGGRAELLFTPADEDDLACFLSNLPGDVPLTIIGLCSNTLIRDGGVRGVVIRLSGKAFGGIEVTDGYRLRVGTAVPDKRVAAAALEAGIGGFAFYHGVPGGIGGALRMNAGANGTETRERVVSVRGVDRSGAVREFSNAEMGYGYRHSSAPVDMVFTQALFEGFPQDRERIREDMDAVEHHRETVQPIREKTGGSTFKNPPGNSAWRLINAAGCRGLTVGGAMMSEMHCNFMINTAQATAYDLELLGETVRARVLKSSGIRLEWEIKRVGAFAPGREVEPFLGEAA